MVANLMNYNGKSKVVTEEYLKDIPVPEKTASYSPLPHWDFVYNSVHLGQEVLGPHGYELGDTKIICSKDDQKMFFTMEWKHPTDDGLSLCKGGRNSLDKSMSAALGMGGKVTVCDNMMFMADLAVFRKHTGDVFTYLKEKLILTFHKARDTWRDMQEEKKRFQLATCTIPEGDHFLCSAVENKVLTAEQFKISLHNWRNSPFMEFSMNDVWGVYNAGTEGLKKGPIGKKLERHKKFHDFTREHFNFDTTAVSVAQHVSRDE
jgi:hypothetical protein